MLVMLNQRKQWIPKPTGRRFRFSLLFFARASAPLPTAPRVSVKMLLVEKWRALLLVLFFNTLTTTVLVTAQVEDDEDPLHGIDPDCANGSCPMPADSS